MTNPRFFILTGCLVAGLFLYSCNEKSFEDFGDDGGQATGGGGSASGGTGGTDPTVCIGGGGGSDGWGGAGGLAENLAGTPVAKHGHLTISDTYLVSECGARVHLKGVSSHWLNWENDGYALSLEALEFMRDEWNLNVIRAAMGVDPAGAYLDSPAGMLSQVETMIENATEAGVYIIVDYHSHDAEDNQEEAIAFFSDMSERYGHLPNVLFETYNEPDDTSWSELRPYHQAVVDAIRASDPDDHENITILGTPTWDQDIDEVIGKTIEDDSSMYTVHFYSCDHTSTYLNRAKNAFGQGVPIFVTEWGATSADGGVDGTPVCDTEADQWLKWMEANSVGWAAWKLDNCNWEIQENGVADTSCLLSEDAPVDGPWNEDDLNGHAPYVVEWMKK